MKYFKIEEFICRCGCGRVEMDPRFLERLDALRGRVGFPLPVSSGYRCPRHNRRVSDTGDLGPHTTGRATDVIAAGDRALIVVHTAVDLGFTGIGISQKGSSRFIHLDDLPALLDRPRPWLWSY